MVNYSDISQLVRDVTELVRKSRDAELIAKATEMAKAINELVVENIELENRLNEFRKLIFVSAILVDSSNG